MKDANVILIGTKHTNPWEELFEKRLNFRLEYAPTVDRSWVVNEDSHGAEQEVYRNGVNGASNHTYETISYLLAPDGNGQMLILQGLNMAATQAAAEVVFNPDTIRPILLEAMLPNGGLRPFELLVETSSVGAPTLKRRSSPHASIEPKQITPRSSACRVGSGDCLMKTPISELPNLEKVCQPKD